MAEVKWIKVVVNIFDDEKMQLIECLPSGDTIIVIWFKILSLAGKQNNGGLIMFNDNIGYTDDMLSTIFKREKTIVLLALQTFLSFGMIEILDNNVIMVNNWEKHQELDKLLAIKEQTRLRVEKHRDKKKQELLECNVTETLCNATDKIRLNKIKLDKNKEDSNIDNNKPKAPYTSILKTWNNLFPNHQIRSVTDSRKKHIKARIDESSIKEFDNMIKIASESTFLNDWNYFKFDWCIKNATNYNKILEGNYKNKKNKNSYTSDNSLGVPE